MKLEIFKIQNYKQIKQSDWIDADAITALFVENEAGKTSVFQALWKLKSASDNIRLDARDEFPRRRYTSEYLKERARKMPVVTAVSKIDEDLRNQLENIHLVLKSAQHV